MKLPYFEAESHGLRQLGFRDISERLILFVVGRIRNGDYTERGLARVAGVSQPHLHHVLKGARPLRPELADVLLACFRINVLDLLRQDELPAHHHSESYNDLWGDDISPPTQNLQQPIRLLSGTIPRRGMGRDTGHRTVDLNSQKKAG